MKQKISISLILVALVLGVGSYVIKDDNRPTLLPTPVQQKKNAPSQSKEQAAANDTTSQTVPLSSQLSVINITETQDKGIVKATAEVGGTKVVSGSCVFTFENELSRPVVRQAVPRNDGLAFICKTGDIPEVEFSAIGIWKLTVRYYDNGAQAVGTENVTIK